MGFEIDEKVFLVGRVEAILKGSSSIKIEGDTWLGGKYLDNKFLVPIEQQVIGKFSIGDRVAVFGFIFAQISPTRYGVRIFDGRYSNDASYLEENFIHPMELMDAIAPIMDCEVIHEARPSSRILSEGNESHSRKEDSQSGSNEVGTIDVHRNGRRSTVDFLRKVWGRLLPR